MKLIIPINSYGCYKIYISLILLSKKQLRNMCIYSIFIYILWAKKSIYLVKFYFFLYKIEILL